MKSVIQNWLKKIFHGDRIRIAVNRAVAFVVLELFLLTGGGFISAQAVSAPPNPGTLPGTGSQGESTAPATTLRSEAFTLDPQHASRISFGNVTLDVPAGAVDAAMTITVEEMPAVHPMNDGMKNVTASVPGYRFLPNGTHFKKDLLLTIPYDKEQVAGGQAASDVSTYFYDEGHRWWTRLKRVSVDSKAGLVTSRTNHFTDFVNSTLALPESPKPLSYNPNSIKDIKAADPGSGITLIDPPTANGQGTANLRYPIELPPGRAGMTPQLAISYNSSGGNGWLGLGWSLETSSITIDTRWGVPRYDAALETETYMLDGGQLTPLANRGAFVPRTDEKTFHARIEGKFERIIRHGSSPSTYWWEATDKNGRIRYYGGLPETGFDPGSVIQAPGNGAVFTWLLRQERDANGNTIDYSHTLVADSGTGNGQSSDGSLMGVNQYLSEIRYTGTVGQPGAYIIDFLRDRQLGETRRGDVTISSRSGFLMTTSDLLRKATVKLNDTPVRSYNLLYKTGAFGKMLLASLIQLGANGTPLATHTFTYYDQIDSNGQYAGFGSQQSWPAGPGVSSTILLGIDFGTALGTTVSTDAGADLYVGGGPVGGPTKNNSGGFKVGYDNGSGDGTISMVDLNGDGLPDKAFRNGSDVFFCKNLGGPAGTPSFGAPVKIEGLPGISHDSTNSISLGGEVYVGSAYGGAHTAHTVNTSTTYFTDVNGDGLVDLVKDGAVYFDHLDANGVPRFTLDSGDTPVPIVTGAPADASVFGGDLQSVLTGMINGSPLLDSVRAWTAPFSGRIGITGSVQLVGAPDASYKTADGVRVAIQKNRSELWSAAIGPNDHGARTPSGVSSLSVDAGDRIFFRVGSIYDGKYDVVAWDPVIIYQDLSGIDANGLSFGTYRASTDFVYAGRGGDVVVPVAGTVAVTGNIHKTAVTSDDLLLVITKNGTIVSQVPVPRGSTGDVPVNQSIAVAAQDSINLTLRVDSPIDLSAIGWQPSITYTHIDNPNIPLTDSNGNPTITVQSLFDIDMYPDSAGTGPYAGWTATPGSFQPDGSLQLHAQAFFLGGGSGSGTTPPSGTFALTVKKNGQLLAKAPFPVVNGHGGTTLTVNGAQPGDKLFLEFSSRSSELKAVIPTMSLSTVVQGLNPFDPPTETPVPFGANFPLSAGLMGQPYRGWGTFAYNGNDGRETAAINPDLLNVDEHYGQDQNGNGTMPMAFVMLPDPADHRWQSQTDEIWVAPDQISSARLGNDYPSVSAPGGGGAQGVPRMSITSQNTIMGGAFGAGASSSDGSSSNSIDFLDLNGDGYPDVVGNAQVQYTMPTGGLESGKRSVGDAGSVRSSASHSNTFGIGGNVPLIVASATSKVADTSQGFMGTLMPLLGAISINLAGNGTSDSTVDLIDVNGDGLPDRVRQTGDSIQVALNLGYGFAAYQTWGAASVSAGETQTAPVSLSPGTSFNIDNYSFGGGVSLSGSSSFVKEGIIDLNGDGLPDRVVVDSQGILVGINTGAGFAPLARWNGAIPGTNISDSDTTSLGGGAYFTFAIPIFFFRIVISPGVHASTSVGRHKTSFMDVNGDGFADEVVSSDSSSITVALNQTGQTNLLQEVDRPLGATIQIGYARTGNTYDVPQSKWVMSSLVINDGRTTGGVDIQRKSFSYSNGSYDRLEKEFLGFGKVLTQDLDENANPYRTTEQDFLTDSFYTKGLLQRQAVSDANGNLFKETINQYLLWDVSTQNAFADQYPYNTIATVFPQLSQTDIKTYEGGSDFTTNRQTFTYDRYGNVTASTDAGDPSFPGDDVYITLQYTHDTSRYIVGKPTLIEADDTQGAMLRKRTGSYDANGNLTQIVQSLQNGANPVYKLSYDQYGNMIEEVDPVGYTIDYTFDSQVQTHIVQMKDSFGYTSTAQYDFRFGLPTASADINANGTTRAYDEFGRLVTVFGPYDQTIPALQFAYYQDELPARAVTKNKVHFDPANPDTLATVIVIDGLKRVIQTKKEGVVSASGGESTTYGMNVTGTVLFDAQGRVAQEGQPVFESGYDENYWSGVTLVRPTINQYDVMDRKTLVTLPDASTIQTTYGVSPASGRTPVRLSTTVTDPMGKQTVRFTDVRENTVEVDRFKAGQTIATTYTYDPISQITAVTDARGNDTTVSYDTLGRRASIDNPDSGLTEYSYDGSGNLIQKVTANLRALHKAITYTYQFDRLMKVNYPFSPDVTYTYGAPGDPNNTVGRITSVTDESGKRELQYGKLGETVWTKKTIGFGRPFLFSIDGDGASGRLKPDSGFDDDHHPPVFINQFRYDYLGRMEYMVYPDGEQLTYGYDKGGQITTVTGVTKHNKTLAYVKAITYDEFGQRVFLHYGNNVITSYQYDPNRRWLSHIKTVNPWQVVEQDTTYSFDLVGDVLSVTNNGYKKVVQSYGYDDLYELVSADGTYTRPSHYYDFDHKTDQYHQSFTYDTIGNMLTKVSSHPKDTSSSPSPESLVYSFTYTYGGQRPHAATKIGNWAYGYDANGNVTDIDWKGDKGGPGGKDLQSGGSSGSSADALHMGGGDRDREHGPRWWGGERGEDWGFYNRFHNAGGNPKDQAFVWDEENRMIHAWTNGAGTDFLYDYNGERTLKRGVHGETWYADKYWQVQNGHEVAKQIFVGDTRVVTRLEHDEWGDWEFEAHNIFYYHPDHLGSTTYVTKGDGDEWEHLEYTPYGEQWIDEGSDRSVIGYRFASKEWDSETGLYYYGARYLDPTTSRWMSADPELGKYIPQMPVNDDVRKRNENLPGQGGVFNLFSLAAYDYTNNNPVRYFDPNGRLPVDYVAAQSAGSTVQEAVQNWVKTSGGFRGDVLMTVTNWVAVQHTKGQMPSLEQIRDYAKGATRGAEIADLIAVAAVLAVPALAESASRETPSAPGSEPITVVHFTSEAGAKAIETSGALRAGSFVTTPSEVSRLSQAEAETVLEIAPGRGAYSATLTTPRSNLVTPFNGPKTSGGAAQFQIVEPIPVKPGTFIPTE